MSLGGKLCPHCGESTHDSHQPSEEIDRAEYYACYACGLRFWIDRDTIPEETGPAVDARCQCGDSFEGDDDDYEEDE